MSQNVVGPDERKALHHNLVPAPSVDLAFFGDCCRVAVPSENLLSRSSMSNREQREEEDLHTVRGISWCRDQIQTVRRVVAESSSTPDIDNCVFRDSDTMLMTEVNKIRRRECFNSTT